MVQDILLQAYILCWTLILCQALSCIIPFFPYNNPMKYVISIIVILSIKKLRHREVEKLVQFTQLLSIKIMLCRFIDSCCNYKIQKF